MEREDKKPMSLEELYERLVYDFTVVHGLSKLHLDEKINSYVKKGLSYEKAIFRVAMETGCLTIESKLPENCPICGEKMEKGYLRAIGGGPAAVGVSWRPPDAHITGPEERLNYGIWSADFRGVRCKNCQIVLLGYSEEMKKIDVDKEHWLTYKIDKYKLVEKELEIKVAKTPEELYEQLLDRYMIIHGSNSINLLENKLKSLMKEGLTREEAIRKLAIKEKLT